MNEECIITVTKRPEYIAVYEAVSIYQHPIKSDLRNRRGISASRYRNSLLVIVLLETEHVEQNPRGLATISRPIPSLYFTPVPYQRDRILQVNYCLRDTRMAMQGVSYGYPAKTHVRHTVCRGKPQRDSVDGSIELVGT